MIGKLTSLLARVFEGLSIVSLIIDTIVKFLAHIVKAFNWDKGQDWIDALEDSNLTNLLDSALEWLKKYKS